MAVIPIIIPVQRLPIYIKKKELDKYINKTKKQIKIAYGIVMGGVMLVQILIAFIVLPRLNNIYNDVGKDLGLTAPNYSVPALVVSLVIGIVILVIAQSMPSLDDEKIKKLKEQTDDMVTINSKLTNKKVDLIVGAYCLISVIVIIASIILPVYRLTSAV